MIAVLILSFLTMPMSPVSRTGQSEPATAPSKAAPTSVPLTTVPSTTVNLATDPYAPLRLYDGKWSVSPAGSKSPDQIENHCARVGDFFACNQFVNGKNMALVIMLPSHPLDNGGYAYRNQALRPDADTSGIWSNLEITGDRWVYSNDNTENGKKTYWRTVNVFSGPDKIHFEVQKSEDDKAWTTTMSGDEVRVK